MPVVSNCGFSWANFLLMWSIVISQCPRFMTLEKVPSLRVLKLSVRNFLRNYLAKTFNKNFKILVNPSSSTFYCRDFLSKWHPKIVIFDGVVLNEYSIVSRCQCSKKFHFGLIYSAI